MAMFNKIAIIGVGLIGSSLALACRHRNVAKKIVGCSKTEKTLITAKALNIIDAGSTNIFEAVKGADVIVLCTPLSTYNSISSTISRSMEKHAILTDTGSVKHLPTEHVLSALSHEQGFHFVPGHPIAGTERSGPEAGFKELFEGRKTILTPLPITNANSVEKIKKMWEAVGSKVEILDTRRHDFIYAAVSHSIQLLSSAYMLALDSLPEEVRQNIINASDINFRKFIRLAGSDPVMWRDIFLQNIHNLEFTIDVFYQNISTIRENIASDESGILKARLENARKKRLYFHELLKGEERKDFRPSDYGNLPETERVWMDIMPRLISCIIMEGISESEYSYATGAGLHGFTKNIILDAAAKTTDIFNLRRSLMEAISIYTRHLKTILDLVLSENSAALYEKLTHAQKSYKKFVQD